MKNNFRLRYPLCRIKHNMIWNDEHCIICMQLFTLDKLKVNFKTGCNHVFHYECIKKWALKTNRCPICRTLLDAQRPP